MRSVAIRSTNVSIKTKLNRMEKVTNKHQTATDVYTVLGAVVSASNLPLNQYKIDVWNEGITYNYIDTEAGVVSYSEMVKLSCGCCYDYEQKEAKIKDLDMLMQCEILIDMYERYCINNRICLSECKTLN